MLTIDNIPEAPCRSHMLDHAAKNLLSRAETLEGVVDRLTEVDPNGPPPNRSVENEYFGKDKLEKETESALEGGERLEGQAVRYIGFCEANAGVVEDGRSKLRRQEPERKLSLVEIDLRRRLYEFRTALERLRKAMAEVRRVLAKARAKQFPFGKPREKLIYPDRFPDAPGPKESVQSIPRPGADGIIDMGPQSRGSRGPGLPPTPNPPRPWRTYDG